MKNSTILQFLCLCASLLAACLSPALPDSAVSWGTLVVTISDGLSRTMEPAISMVPASYKIEGRHSGGDSFFANVSAAAAETSLSMDHLAAGEWTITVIAMNDASPVAFIIGRATGAFFVRDKETATGELTVRPLQGPGTLTLTAAWNGTLEAISIEADLTTTGGTVIPIRFPAPEGGSATFATPGLEAGYYTLRIQLFDTSTLVSGATETVRIIAGADTKGTILFSDLAGPGGALRVDIGFNLLNPVRVTVARNAATGEGEGRLNLVALTEIGAEAGTVVCEWFINGVAAPDAYLSGNASLSLPCEFSEGYYRVDALVTVTDSGRIRAGNGSFVLYWKGSLPAAPERAGSGWGYFDTTKGQPYYHESATSSWTLFSPSPTGQGRGAAEPAVPARHSGGRV